MQVNTNFKVQLLNDGHWGSDQWVASRGEAESLAERLYARPGCKGVRVVHEYCDAVTADLHAITIFRRVTANEKAEEQERLERSSADYRSRRQQRQRRAAEAAARVKAEKAAGAGWVRWGWYVALLIGLLAGGGWLLAVFHRLMYSA